MAGMDTVESWIPTPLGRLFAKRWDPGAANATSPIVMLHDSLGCVALWRALPERLASATGRPVIAYDRVGFGRSDPHPGKPGAEYNHAEAD